MVETMNEMPEKASTKEKTVTGRFFTPFSVRRWEVCVDSVNVNSRKYTVTKLTIPSKHRRILQLSSAGIHTELHSDVRGSFLLHFFLLAARRGILFLLASKGTATTTL
jgi:hypothetical protein